MKRTDRVCRQAGGLCCGLGVRGTALCEASVRVQRTTTLIPHLRIVRHLKNAQNT